MKLHDSCFTHIIVGAGSSGCLLANRLSASSKNSVLLLETGGWNSNFWLKLPVGYYRSINNKKVSRHYATIPSTGTAGRSIDWPRGQVVGGSSSINGLIFTRGQKENFDNWAMQSDPSWGFDNVLPHFRNFENFSGPLNEFHNNKGELHVSELRNDHPFCRAWIKAALQFGLPQNNDFNGASSLGIGSYHLSIGKRWRSSAYDAFLKPILGRGNLTVKTNTFVEKINIKEGVATGVQLRHQGKTMNVRAIKETVLCAGAIQTPQLLQLSGIGPEKLLKKLHIPVLVNRPSVGGNLQDHYQMRTIVKMKRALSFNNYVRNPFSLIKMGLEWLFLGRGPLTVGAGQVGGGARTEYAKTIAPDIQFFIMPLSVDKPGDPLHSYPGFTASVWQCHPESRGRVDIISSNPEASPKIQPNYLKSRLDQKTLISGVKMLREIHSQSEFKNLWTEEMIPGKFIQSDEEILREIQKVAGTVYHYSGSCRMGNDDEAVVNPELQVRGICHLRIADASIMPSITSANTNAATYMIAEKAAQMMLRCR